MVVTDGTDKDEKPAKVVKSKSMDSQRLRIHWGMVVGLPIWTYGAFILATFIVVGLLWALQQIGISLNSLNVVIFNTISSVVIYALALTIAIGVPLLVWSRRTTRKELGVSSWPVWLDLLMATPAYVVYIIISASLLMVAKVLFSGVVDLNVEQEIPFSQTMLTSQFQYILAFFTLVVLAPVAEELLFRGYLYGKLRKVSPAWLAIIVSGLAFGLAHLWAGPGAEALQWAVMIDTLALGVVLAMLRESTGAIWAGVLVHAIKNGIAFYFLFMNPQIIDQLKTASALLM